MAHSGIEFERPDGSEPVYLSIVRQVKSRLAAGQLHRGDPLPSRRELAVQLEINPNTVQKAYKILEDEGILASQPGSGSVLCASDETVDAIREGLAHEAAQIYVNRLRDLGLDFRSAVQLLGDNWKD
ncbi:MAG: GntR family transcriptional regulator [Clostridia bacterium]|nr:GntR family transcriptional regulator [Clostridia bacterium]